jgi:uncharacterized membrane protein
MLWRVKRYPRLVLAAFMLTVGILLFVSPDFFVSIVPAWLPGPCCTRPSAA